MGTTRRSGRNMVAGVAAAALALAVTAAFPGPAQGFTLIELMLVLFGTGCSSTGSPAWTLCLANGTCQDGFSVGVAPTGRFAELVREKPNSNKFLYSYGDGSAQIQATMRISERDLEDIARWRTHFMETKQPLRGEIEGRWQLKRAGESVGTFPGKMEFQFLLLGDASDPREMVCVTAVYKN